MIFRNRKIWQTIAAVAFFAVIISSAWFLLGNENLIGAISRSGVWAPFLLIILKISTIVVSPLGGTPIYFAVPSLFGFWPGFFYLVIADTIGYSAVFWISRVYGRRVMNWMLSDKQIEWADGVLKYMSGWKGLTIIRLTFAPFADTISYAAGLTRISFREYFLATFPLIFFHVVITNNVSAAFVKDQISYIIVVVIAVSLPLVLIIFRKKIKKAFISIKNYVNA